MGTFSEYSRKINRAVSQGSDILGTAESVGQLFGVSVADALGINAQNIHSDQSGFSINNFNAKLNSRGVLKDNLFVAMFGLPKFMQGNLPEGTGDLSDIFLYCSKADIPGVGFQSLDGYKRHGYGPMESIPQSPTFSDLNTSFMQDTKGSIYKFFYTWTNNIVNYNQERGMDTSVGGLNSYEVAYKDDYQVQLLIWIYDDARERMMSYVFNEAYPKTINPVQFSWDSENSFSMLDISWGYTDWYMEDINITNGVNSLNTQLTLHQQLMKGISVLQTAVSVKPRTVQDVVNVINNANIITDLF